MYRRISIRIFLTLTLGILSLVPMVIILAVTLTTAGRNTNDLLRDKVRLVTNDLISSATQYLLPAEAVPLYMADMLASGEIDGEHVEGISQPLLFALAAAPHLQSVAYLHADGWMLSVFRDVHTDKLGFSHEAWTDNQWIADAIQDGIDSGHESYWGEPLFIDESGRSILYFAHIIRQDGEFHAALAASVELGRLSRFLDTAVPDFEGQTFILTSDDEILAHRYLGSHDISIDAEFPVPDLVSLGDPVLADIWQEGWQTRKLEIVGNGHVNDLDVGEYIYLYEPLPFFGWNQPWLIGGYLTPEQAGNEFERLIVSAIIGILVALVTVALALRFAQLFARPTVRLANAAEAVEKLDFEHVPALPQSRLTEVDQAYRAFERMTAALTLFGRYVPRRLVMRLLQQGNAEAPLSEERDVTIMFADIKQFTRITAAMAPQECAVFLNDVFTDLASCIEDEGGTVDKFIGDAIMAFWNAPERQPDHATRACRAALAMRKAVEAHNGNHDVPFGLRIGIHSGRVTVGNIGPESRFNYTIVGTPVNTTQRLEQLGKSALPNDTVAILASEHTVTAAACDLDAVKIGDYQLVQGSDALAIYRI